MTEETKKYLHDILVSITSIEEYLGTTRNYHLYQQNKMLKRAVERELEIIGEAMSRILKIDENIAISSKLQIVGIRNRIIHGYDKVDDEIVWGTISRHLPILKNEIAVFLEIKA